MGLTFVDVKVANPARPKKASVFEFLVDSGAVYSVVPAKDLKKLGIKPVRTKEFILANGEKVTKEVGNALYEFGGEIGAAPVILGDEGVYLLGATTLESLGLMLDPLRRELKPLPMLLMTAIESERTPIQPVAEQRKVLGRYIVMDPEICHGQMTFRGTRIFVKDVLDQVADGMSWEEIMRQWRGNVSMPAIAEAVRLARKSLFEIHHQPFPVDPVDRG
jgi:uncharacterized protein (DUF433 family)/predicted aspartyl protease